MIPALDRIESGPWILHAPALIPLLVAVARAAEGFRGWPNVHVDEALAAVERYADEHMPEVSA